MDTNQSVYDADKFGNSGHYILVTTTLPSGLQETSIIHLDATTTTIEARTFDDYDIKNITSVVLSEGIETIADRTFHSWLNLVSVTFSDSVITIGNGAFSNCRKLISVTLGDSVETIDRYAFYNCLNLVSITISDLVKMIGHATFDGCKRLEKIYIKTHDEEVFERIKQLLPESLRGLAQPLTRKKSARSAIIHDEVLGESKPATGAVAQNSVFSKKSSHESEDAAKGNKISLKNL